MKITVTNECLLTSASPVTEDRLKQALTMKNPAYLEALKRGRWTGKLDKELFFYRPGPDRGLCFPRGFLRQALSIIDEHVGCCDRRRSLADVDFSRPLDVGVAKASEGIISCGQINLRPYQAQALADILKKDFGVLEALTGSGKTVIALAAIAARKQPTLILVHNKELMNQWVDRISSFLGVEAGRIGDGKYEVRLISVAIINSAKKYLEELPQYFGQIVVDEVHRCPSAMFSQVVQAFDCKYMLGLSATPYRRDKLTRLIYMYVGDLVHQIDPAELRDVGAVLALEIIFKKTKFYYEYPTQEIKNNEYVKIASKLIIDASDDRYGTTINVLRVLTDNMFSNEYAKMLDVLTKDVMRNTNIIMDVLTETQNYQGGTCLVVSDRIEHCNILAKGISCGAYLKGVQILTGRAKSVERQEIVEAVNAGQIKVLIATLQLIGEGFDCHRLSSLFLATPIKFSGRLIQIIGRILRPGNGKQPRVYDYQDPVGVLIASARARKKTYREMGYKNA